MDVGLLLVPIMSITLEFIFTLQVLKYLSIVTTCSLYVWIVGLMEKVDLIYILTQFHGQTTDLAQESNSFVKTDSPSNILDNSININ